MSLLRENECGRWSLFAKRRSSSCLNSKSGVLFILGMQLSKRIEIQDEFQVGKVWLEQFT